MLFLFQWAVGPVEVQVSSPNRPLLSCALRINLVFKNLQSFSIYPKSGVLGVVYSVVQFSTSMCTVCNQIHTLTSRGWAQEFIHSSKRSLSQTPPSSQPPWCFQFPPCSSDQSSHSATHSCNCTHILRQAGEHRKRKSKGILPHPLETTASLVGEEVSFPWAVGCCGLCLHAQLRVTGCTESRLQEYRVWQRDSLPVGGTWDSDLSPPQSSHCYLLFWILKQQVQAFCSGPSAPSVEEMEWIVLTPSYLEPAQSQLVLFSDVTLW